MRSCWEILFVALLMRTGWSFPHHSHETCSLCSPGTRVLQACTPLSDTVCAPCGPDTYSDAPNNASRCQLCSKCPENTYISRSCSQTSDTICSPCSTSPQMKSTNYLTSCDNTETVIDPHDLMMGDDAGVLEGANNHEHGDKEPSDAVKEEGDQKHADEAKDVGNDNKDDTSNTANDNENTADDIGKEKKDDATNDVKEEPAGNSEDNAENSDKTAGSEHHESKDGESVKKETESEHAAEGGSEAAHPATDDAAGDAVHDTADEPSHDTPDEPPQDTPEAAVHDTADKTAHDSVDETVHNTAGDAVHDTADKPPQDTPDEPPQDTPHEPPQDTPNEPPQDIPDKPPQDTPDESPKDTPDEPPQDTPNEPVHDSADKSPQDTPDEPPQDIPDEPPQDTPNEPVHDTADKPPQDTPDEPPQDTPDEPPQDTPNEPVHDTADKSPQVTPDEPPQDTPDEPPQDTPNETPQDIPDKPPQDTPDAMADDTAAETVHDTADKTVHDTADKTVHDTAAETADDTADKTVHDTPDKTTHDTAPETAHDTAAETVHGTGDEAVHDTVDETAPDTENKKAHNTMDETDNNTDETGAEPGDTVDNETGDEAGDETKKGDGNKAAGETGNEPEHDITDGVADNKADESTLDTEDEATDGTADKTEDDTGDKAPSETADGEVGSEGAHNSTGGAGDWKVDEPPQDTGDEPRSDVGEKTEDNQGDNVAGGDAGNGTAHETVDGSEDNEDLHSPRVLEPEHKEFGGDHPEGSHGVNDSIVLAGAPDGQRENTSDDHPADSNSLDITAESSDASSHGNTEHDAELLNSTHEHSENTTDVEGKDGEKHLIQTDKGEEGTTESPEDNRSSLHLLHHGIEEPHSDDNNNTEALTNTDEGSDIEPVLGRILSGDTKNVTQDEESTSPGETPTSSPHAGEVVDIGAISLNESDSTDTGLTGSNVTESPNVVIGDPGHAPVVVIDDPEHAPVVVINDSENTTVAAEHPEEAVHELTTTAAVVENSTADDGGLDPLFILEVPKEETKDAHEAGTKATGLEVVEEASTARTPEADDVSHGEGGELVEVVTVAVKSTKRIPTLEELEAQYTEPETDHTTKGESSDAQNRALSGEHKIAEGGIGSSHHGDEEYEDNKRTAIIVGVTIGGVALFALGFFASRYYKKRRGQFKEMKKVNSGKDVEALEFEPLQQNKPHDDSELSPSNGIYRPRGKASPPFPLKNKREEKADVTDLYAVPEKSTRAPLLGLTPPIEELSQSPSAQEPLISGVEKLKYIDDSTDDEYVNTVRTSLLPSRSPASRLSNVVEETPPTTPSITQPYRPNWSTNQSKSGGSSSYTNGSTPKHTHSSVSSQGSLTNDVMNALSNQTQVKTDNRNKGSRVNRKQAHSDEDIEC